MNVSSQIFFRRRRALHDAYPEACFVVAGADLRYLTGCGEANARAILSPEHARLYVERDASDALWRGEASSLETLAEAGQLDAVRTLGALDADLLASLGDARRLHYRLGSDDDGRVVAALEAHARAKHRRGMGLLSVLDPAPAVGELRLRKSPEELALIEEAVIVTASALRQVMASAAPGQSERALAASFEAALYEAGAEGLAFATIVASGPRATALHASPSGHVSSADELLLIDGGAVAGGYAADLSRTFPLGERFDTAQRQIYELVLQARDAAMANLRPGGTLVGAESAARQTFAAGLEDLGVRCAEGEAVEQLFPHRIGHWLGLEAHDAGPYLDASGDPRPLEAGMVLTIEPGLYFRELAAVATPTAYQGLAVRVEDTIAICEEEPGYRVLGEGIAPRDVADLEALRG